MSDANLYVQYMNLNNFRYFTISISTLHTSGISIHFLISIQCIYSSNQNAPYKTWFCHNDPQQNRDTEICYVPPLGHSMKLIILPLDKQLLTNQKHCRIHCSLTVMNYSTKSGHTIYCEPDRLTTPVWRICSTMWLYIKSLRIGLQCTSFIHFSSIAQCHQFTTCCPKFAVIKCNPFLLILY